VLLTDLSLIVAVVFLHINVLVLYNVHDIIQLSCVVFCWQLKEVYTLLNENYVEDDDNMFRFDYSPEFLHWLVTACVYSQGLSQ